MITRLFYHATIGDGFDALKTIREPEVNLAIARNIVTADVADYLGGIDLHKQFKSDWDEQPSSRAGCNKNCGACTMATASTDRAFIQPAIFKVHDPQSENTRDIVHAGLHKFPQGTGFASFADIIERSIRVFSEQTDAQKVEASILVKYTAGGATWHRDNGTDIRGLVTMTGPGTYWRPNHTVPDEDWLQDHRDETGRPYNTFGRFGLTFMEHAQQVERGSMVLMKGGLHSRPIIHAEPTHGVTGNRREARVVLHMDMAQA